MPNASIYWQPADVGTVRELDLGEPLTSLTTPRASISSSSQALHNSYQSQQYGFYDTVRVTLELFNDVSVFRKLVSLESHLRAGLAIGLAADNTNTVAGFIRADSAIARGDKTFQTTGTLFDYTGTSTLANGDIIVIESPSPNGWREYKTVDALTSTTITATTGAVFSHDAGIVMFRQEQFFPVLRLDMDRHNTEPILTSLNGTRRLWTLDMTLRVDIGAAQAAYSEDGQILSTLTQIGESIDSIDINVQTVSTGRRSGWDGSGKWGGS